MNFLLILPDPFIVFSPACLYSRRTCESFSMPGRYPYIMTSFFRVVLSLYRNHGQMQAFFLRLAEVGNLSEYFIKQTSETGRNKLF